MKRLYVFKQIQELREITRLDLIEKVCFFLLILFLPTQLGKHFWPPFSIVAGLRVDYLSPTFYMTDLLFFCLFSIACIRLVKHKEYIAYDTSVIIKTIILLVSLLVNIFFSQSPLAAFYGAVRVLEYLLFALYLTYKLREKSNVMLLTSGLAVSAAFESFLSIAQFMNQGSINGLFYYVGERTFTSATPGIANASINGTLMLRPYGTLPHPNVLAGFLLISLIIIGKTFLSTKNKLFFCSFLCILPGFLLTLSRSAFLAVGALCFFVLIRIVKKRQYKRLLVMGGKSRIYIAVCVAALVMAMFLIGNQLIYRTTHINIWGEDVQERLLLTQASFAMIRDHLFLGVGLKNFLIVLPSYSLISKQTTLLQPVHNIYLLILAEIGIPATLLITLTLFSFYKRSHPQNNFQKLLIMIVVIIGFFDHYFLTLHQGCLLLSVIIGLVLAQQCFTYREEKNNRKEIAKTG